MVYANEAKDTVIAELREENDKLRGILANSVLDCIYCGLAKADLNKCALGFPGCGRADDMVAALAINADDLPDVIEDSGEDLISYKETHLMFYPGTDAWEYVDREVFNYWLQVCQRIINSRALTDGSLIARKEYSKRIPDYLKVRWELPGNVCLFEHRWVFTPAAKYIVYWPAVNRLVHEASIP